MSSPSVIKPRAIKLTTRTGVEVHRLLPQAALRKVSAWCFLDVFGPTAARDSMVVAAHPHTGLQTATWLLDGHVEHRDSLGSVQTLRPGEFNLMTAGRGIAHSELGLESQTMHAVQLWIALPDSVRNCEPSFEHHSSLPRVVGRGFDATVFAGEFHGATSPATMHWPLFGAQVGIDVLEPVELTLNANFEHGFLPLTGGISVDGVEVAPGSLCYLPVGSAKAEIFAHRAGTQLLLIGGEPFDERLVMWWNFIGRSHQEIVDMRENWNNRGAEIPELVQASHDQFGAVFPDRVGGWIPAPELPNVELRSR
jgi:redox-sensitive bicupin YhaK (pirin superfamily)